MAVPDIRAVANGVNGNGTVLKPVGGFEITTGLSADHAGICQWWEQVRPES